MKTPIKIVLISFSLVAIGYTVNFFYNYYLKNEVVFQEALQHATETLSSATNKLPTQPKEKQYLVLEYHVPVMYPGDSPVKKVNETLPANAQLIPMEKVTNVGYTFYLGAIDYPGSSPINDVFKNYVTNIINDAHFPQSLLNNLSIVTVNSLAATSLMYMETPSGWIKMDNFNPSFLSEGGQYVNYMGVTSYILLNKLSIGDPNSLRNILTHELGHDVGMQMSDNDWKEYCKLRGIPTTISYCVNPSQPAQTKDQTGMQARVAALRVMVAQSKARSQPIAWNASPLEDFAEVYKNTYTGIPVITKYGLVNAATKKFINNLVGKLNK